jgi:hypothetical protein
MTPLLTPQRFTVKKVRELSVPSRDVTTKLSLGGNKDVITELFLPRGSLVSDIPAGDGKLVNLFLRCLDQGCRLKLPLYILKFTQEMPRFGSRFSQYSVYTVKKGS